jgi:hypothetical protein
LILFFSYSKIRLADGEMIIGCQPYFYCDKGDVPLQTCSVCFSQSPDSALTCTNCQADLAQKSTTAVALKRFQANPRIQYVRISVAGDACPECAQHQRTYPKDQVPALPIEGCSHELGCRCFYDPVLEELFP